MSYALSAFLCPKDSILQLPGSRDTSLLHEILTGSVERLSELDEQLVDDDDEDDITHEQALRELFTGNITAEFYMVHVTDGRLKRFAIT